jgi:transposase
LSHITREIYPLLKEPTGSHIDTDNIVGIDPGVRNLLTCTRNEQEEKKKSYHHLKYQTNNTGILLINVYIIITDFCYL